MALSTLLQDALSIILAQLPCECHFPGIRPPASPPLSAQEGELEGLLRDDNDAAWLDGDNLEVVSLKRALTSGPSKNAGMISRPGSSSRAPATYDHESESGPDEGPITYDADPSPLERGTLDKLPELARRYEPTFTLEDMEREEREQEERDRRAESATKLGKRFADLPGLSRDDEFGGFEQAPGIGGQASVDPLGAMPIAREGSRGAQDQATRLDVQRTGTSGKEDDEDSAEVSFGLGESESDDEA